MQANASGGQSVHTRRLHTQFGAHLGKGKATAGERVWAGSLHRLLQACLFVV